MVLVCGLKEWMDFPKVPSFTPAQLRLQLYPRWFPIPPIQMTESKVRVLYCFAFMHWPPGLCLESLSCNTLQFPAFHSVFLLRLGRQLCLTTALNSMLGFLQHQLTSLLGWWGDKHSFLFLLNIKGSLFDSLVRSPSQRALRPETATRNSC